jgi:hypothetical protein
MKTLLLSIVLLSALYINGYNQTPGTVVHLTNEQFKKVVFTTRLPVNGIPGKQACHYRLLC